MASLSPNEFLSHRRLALAGVSRDPRSFSRVLFRELRARGYDVVPINPAGGSIDGVPCLPRLQDVDPAVEGALLLTPPDATAQVVRECADAGVHRVWMHQGIGAGSASPAALALCEERGIAAVTGACAFMFLPDAGWVHRLHAWWRRPGH